MGITPIIETEKSLIGILLQKPDFLVSLSRVINPGDFYDTKAGIAYSTILDMWKDKKHVDLVSVSSRLHGYATYLSLAIEVIPLTAAAIQYATEIRDAARARRVGKRLTEILAHHKQNPQYTLSDISDLYQSELQLENKEADINHVINRFKKTQEKNKQVGKVGLSTGFQFLEEMFISYQQGQVWTIGGFTSVGKTAIMIEALSRIFYRNEDARVLVISTEMTETQIIARMTANQTKYGTNVILSGRIEGQAKEHINKSLEYLSNRNCTIYDDIYTITDIETAGRKADMQGGVDIIFIDYVQNCQVPEAKSEYQAQSTLAKRLQKMAKDLNATVICLSQVSNAIGRGDSTQLELKGAGEWAAVSDISILLSRGKDNDNAVFFEVKKNRHGRKHGAREGHILNFVNGFTRLAEYQSVMATGMSG